MTQCPKCAAPLQEIELSGGQEILTCTSCSGAFYPAAALAFAIEVKGLKASKSSCPKCRAKLETGTAFNDRLELEKCSGCGGIWLDAGEVQQLRELAKTDAVINPEAGFAAGMFPPARPAETEERTEAAEQVELPKDPSTRNLHATDSAYMKNRDAAAAPTATLNGREYAHYQTAIAEVTYVLGEFNWKVAVKDVSYTRDFICPPYLLSEDVSDEDSTWSMGEYLEPEEVWAAFGMEGSPPSRLGVAPAQPNPHVARLGAILGSFFVFCGLVAAVSVCLWLAAQNKIVYSGGFEYKNTDLEKSRVTPEFKLEGRTTNLEVTTDTSLENHWGYFRIALINADTDEALDFGREISYYQGYDDEGRWTEGKKYDRVILPSVAPGRYYLRVEPETDAALIAYRIALRREVPQVAPALIALLLICLPVLWVWWRRRNFEYARWQESDHPWTTSGSDDDDD